MKAVAKIDEKQIEEMDLTITFTMKVSEWRALMKQNTDKWPSWIVGSHISKVLSHITRSTQAEFTDPKE